MSSVPPSAHSGDLDLRLAQNAAAIETLLETLLSDAPAAGEIVRPPRLVAAMRHGALGGGKRLRPFLTVETAGFLGVPAQQARRAGAAVELLHCYSLVHDDLPAMDDDDLRRGRPTVHKAFDEATAILAGDALLTLAFDVLADEATHPDGGVRAALVTSLARATGLGGMVGGQMLDLAAEGRFETARSALSDAEIRRLQAMKTGALLAASVEIGARLGGADAVALAALGRYGRALGATFQIADDILDVESDAAQMGKATAKDADQGKGTLVGALGLDRAKRERDRLSAEAVAALSGFGPEADMLRAAARFAAERKS
ncbi:MAG: polyprenyl synthetase family protein [Bosea sp.]|uniref:polyprenyl synthetase family protein n=1 Tax=Bosea sp. (in: a-proteobacteria) TaxID=1871050 RepID=UPI001ACFA4BD|nr:farnesyl diphosphate synthase [Bosea sp. (in: a-proteobacteria)]MBN9454577.1 polyprenyl synthetase family protein [Bosea sp. (in: a-proteobacteria)]